MFAFFDHEGDIAYGTNCAVSDSQAVDLQKRHSIRALGRAASGTVFEITFLPSTTFRRAIDLTGMPFVPHT
jgi:hypothetical protein